VQSRGEKEEEVRERKIEGWYRRDVMEKGPWKEKRGAKFARHMQEWIMGGPTSGK